MTSLVLNNRAQKITKAGTNAASIVWKQNPLLFTDLILHTSTIFVWTMTLTNLCVWASCNYLNVWDSVTYFIDPTLWMSLFDFMVICIKKGYI